jgi:hypothetical protein
MGSDRSLPRMLVTDRKRYCRFADGFVSVRWRVQAPDCAGDIDGSVNKGLSDLPDLVRQSS